MGETFAYVETLAGALPTEDLAANCIKQVLRRCLEDGRSFGAIAAYRIEGAPDGSWRHSIEVVLPLLPPIVRARRAELMEALRDAIRLGSLEARMRHVRPC